MASNMTCVFVFLLVATYTTAYPLEMIEDDSWLVRMFPNINMAYMENCYYNASSWKNDSSSYCPDIMTNSSTPSRLLPDKLIDPLRAMYQEYARNEPHDQQLLVDCFMLYKYSGNSSACSLLVSNQTRGLKNTRREHNAQVYLQELTEFLAQVDRCLEKEWQMLPLSSDCEFLDELELVEHCFMYHQFDHYEACQNVSWPHLQLPKDSRSMYIYLSWQNITFEFNEQLEELRMGMEGIPDPMAMVLYCLHDNSWIEDSRHQCYNLTEPQKGLTYSSQDRKLQKMYNQKRRDELRYDCLTFHKHEKLTACKWITWR